MSRSFVDNINSFNASNASNHYTLADGKSGILKWLSPLERRIRHQNVRTCWVHVGGRLLETDEFVMCHGGAQYEGSDHAILFCWGDPGICKTYLSSEIIYSEK